jgi:hypothetical protein
VNAPDRNAALRPLHAQHDAIQWLRQGQGDPEAQRTAVIGVADAIEITLRRLLRDDPAQPISVRLQALAPDEFSAESVVSALRRRDAVSIELAASFHDLLSVRRRMQHGMEPTRRDVEQVVQLAERTEQEVLSPPASRVPPVHDSSDDTLLLDAPPPAAEDPPIRSLTASRQRLSWHWVGAATGLLLVLALGLWWISARSGPGLSEAIALFRTGDFARAEEQFRQHAARRPDDPTPRLYLARIYRRTGRLEQARDELRQALAAAPTDAALHRELGFLLLDGGQPDAAVERFRTAVELEPGATDGWLGLYRALVESGQYEAAERILARAPDAVRAAVRGSAPAPTRSSPP